MIPGLEAIVVQAKPKSVPRSSSKKKFVAHSSVNHNYQSVDLPVKNQEVGIILKENVNTYNPMSNVPVYGKGKGKALLFAAAPAQVEVSDFDDEVEMSACKPQFPLSDACFQATLIDYSLYVGGEGVRMVSAPPLSIAMVMSPVLLQVVYPSYSLQGN